MAVLILAVTTLTLCRLSAPSTTITTVTTSTVPTFTPPVTQRHGCNAITTTYLTCFAEEQLAINEDTLLNIRIKPNASQPRGNSLVQCQWSVFPREGHHTNVTITQGADGFIGNFSMVVLEKKLDHSSGKSLFAGTSIEEVKLIPASAFISNANLSETGSFHLHSLYKLYFFFDLETHASREAEVLTLCFEMGEGVPMLRLPRARLSNTAGYVTSPGFDDGLIYPEAYDGFLDLNVAENESLMITFTHLDVKDMTGLCARNYVQMLVAGDSTPRKMCEQKDIPVQILRSSFRILFHVGFFRRRGFKMMYASLPRSQEPKQLPGDLWNCSVPHFHSFQPLLSCNLLRECQGGEDEQGCGYYSNECGYNSIEAGFKCYRVIRHSSLLSWADASRYCMRHGQQLATFGTLEEFKHFKAQIPFAKNANRFFVGARLDVRQESVSTNALYRYVWWWVDKRSAFTIQIDTFKRENLCAVYIVGRKLMSFQECDEKSNDNFVCEFKKEGVNSTKGASIGTHSIVLQKQEHVVWNVSVVQCPSGHVTRDFLSCDSQSDCGSSFSVTSCSAGNVTVPMFVCQQSRSTVHYSLLCDHVQHCPDNTDEDFCYHPDCPQLQTHCRNRQCVRREQMCNRVLDCFDGSDELCFLSRRYVLKFLPPFALYINSEGILEARPMKDSEPCPETHFPCQDDTCLPVFFLCNGIADCPGREDEAGCDSYTCPGFYRCRGSRVCVHADHVCDGVPQCPQQDDELLCALTCPDACRCQGLAFVCSTTFSTRAYPAVRYLDASGTGMTPADVTDSIYLVSLRLSACNIRRLSLNVTLPNLRELDLSWNEVIHVDTHYFQSLKNLRELVLTGNPLTQFTSAEPSGPRVMVLEHIDLSHTSLQVFNGSLLKSFPALKALNLSWSKLHTVTDDGLQLAATLQTLDVRGSALSKFPSNLLRGLNSLSEVYADNYKLCCEAMLPFGFPSRNCHAPQDLFASCEDLLKSNTYRVFLWTFAFFSVVGNAGSIGTRLYLHRKREAMGSFSVFVTNLCVSDLLMGVYLAVVGVADVVYHGEYLWHDNDWKSSGVCSFAGFLSFLSSEVSAFVICLITLDRFLVIRFPFSGIHFGRCSALLACSVVWLLGATLATFPLLPWISHWDFYGQTGMCIPLPFTSSESFHGYRYSFGVMIVLNLVLFLLIAVGQAAIYWAVRANSMSSSSKSGSSKDSAIARRLTAVVVSDFLCWFPIGVLGLLASRGTPIPGEVSVAVAIFVLPLNSSLNPFLYTLNVIAEKRRKAQEARLLKLLQSRLQA